MKAIFSLLFLVLAITCTVIVQGTPYQKFKDQHYQYSMAKRDCDTSMDHVNNRYFPNQCKPVNSFITGTDIDGIKAVCARAGVPYPKDGRVLRKSTQRFRVMTCRRNGDSEQPPCGYRAYENFGFIVIDCNWQKLPVHYETIIY
ncbi:hypothetical protein SKAU_G00196660 [Synaphobranchus kaupii]|uniref:Ribonuclease A-domain domain-containing protein n=1 Tax=Synaphobranchus kaupii TaxID=118154 RepID=A0A9Q1IVQ6_SYNKA|nr:hypothetical protein SKAU_G00196660 [Synaphobranchus kaupii]